MGVLLLLLLLLLMMIGCMVILCLSFTYMMSQRVSAATLPELCPTDEVEVLIINHWIRLVVGKLRSSTAECSAHHLQFIQRRVMREKCISLRFTE